MGKQIHWCILTTFPGKPLGPGGPAGPLKPCFKKNEVCVYVCEYHNLYHHRNKMFQVRLDFMSDKVLYIKKAKDSTFV